MQWLLSQGRAMLGIVEMPGACRWVAASLIDAIGTGLLIPVTVLYFTLHVGLSVRSVGLGLTIGGLVAFGLGPCAGVLMDAFGAKPVLLGCWVLAALGYASYGLVENWPQFVIAVATTQAATSAASTARMALLANVATGQQRARLLSSQRSIRNLGYGIGGLLATAALAVGGTAYLFVVYGDALSFLVAIVLVKGLPVGAPERVASRRASSVRGLQRVVRDRRYVTLSILEFFTSFNATALDVALPLWVVLHTRAPRAVIGALFVVNTITVVGFQVRATERVRGLRDVATTYRRAAALMVACAAAYLAAHYLGEAAAVLVLIAGAVAQTGVEICATAADWLVAVGLADPAYRGTYLSVYSLGMSLQRALGPTIITSVMLVASTELWPVLAALVCLGTLLSASLASPS